MRIISSLLISTSLLVACSSRDAASENGMGTHPLAKGTTQTPAMGAAEMTTWLAGGAYLKWHCEPEVHEARFPSPHGYNRICSNDVVAAAAGGTGDWPVGAAAVKELHLGLMDEPAGYSVYLKTDADSAGGANWYWYELYPTKTGDSGFRTALAADGLGNGGAARDVCVACHVAAGSDAKHTPSPGGRDQVYTPVAR